MMSGGEKIMGLCVSNSSYVKIVTKNCEIVMVMELLIGIRAWNLISPS